MIANLDSQPVEVSIAHEHAGQLALCDLLVRAIADGHPAERMQSIIAQLVHLSEAHFSSERFLMESLDYPAMDRHQREHEALLEEMAGLDSLPTEQDGRAGNQQVLSIRTALLQHIEGMDRSLSSFLLSSDTAL